MSVLIIAESQNNTIRSASNEAVFYGKKVAESLGTTCAALVIGEASGAASLGKYGADKVLQVDTGGKGFDSQAYTQIIKQVAQQESASVIVLMHSSTGKSLAGRLAIAMDAGLLSGATALPQIDGSSMIVSKTVFSGKAIANYELTGDVKVISVMGNSLKPELIGEEKTPNSLTLDLPTFNTEVLGVKTQSGTVPLPEAELVVSAGRGMKGPENWGIIEELANELQATTACSRPVADIGWRPHHEHVGQTGVAIRPNLYIAIGISGAIQHLAGVNNSKVIVVINKDPEAPFFKAADYGICADLFDVVPKLTAALQKAK